MKEKPNCLKCKFFSYDRGCNKGVSFYKIRYENYEETCKYFILWEEPKKKLNDRRKN